MVNPTEQTTSVSNTTLILSNHLKVTSYFLKVFMFSSTSFKDALRISGTLKNNLQVFVQVNKC